MNISPLQNVVTIELINDYKDWKVGKTFVATHEAGLWYVTNQLQICIPKRDVKIVPQSEVYLKAMKLLEDIFADEEAAFTENIWNRWKELKG